MIFLAHRPIHRVMRCTTFWITFSTTVALSYQLQPTFRHGVLFTVPNWRFQSRLRSQVWDVQGLSQDDLMYKDECLIVNDHDEITGHRSKFEAHRFSTANPSGLLHRAFSVFLFDCENRLLLQQRASSKITFPDVWTNTCCSHPLFGYVPSEIDNSSAIACGKPRGIYRAAIRKLHHELGIDTGTFDEEDFKYLTRIQYSAPCTLDDTQSENIEPFSDLAVGDSSDDGFLSWGETEIDYILMLKLSAQATPLALRPNPEEVRDVKFVSKDQLLEMMDRTSGLQWSPWFQIIVDNFLVGGRCWWDDLQAVMESDKYNEFDTITRVI